ncbi:spindle and kinetochore-associated protein 2 [Prunus yedoensis var. nudiflora]|uniref:Protein FAM33A n=1 Tax=Prunus yedoensis var. nudiflora TaxID=2094558 RepID=A0A314ZVL7_PRUYE|nr:spindle and kinetochore-associated protein 2 [Prunus yedoensis var. nudiflora]
MGHVSEHHEATDGLVKLLTKANHDLTVVQHRLEREFQQIYPENANPMKLVSRIKKIQEELSNLEEQCRELLSAKQARTTLVGNRNLVQRMETSMGISPNTDSEDSAFANFNQIIDEWTVQVRSKTGDEKHDSDSEDINQLLFSAIV